MSSANVPLSPPGLEEVAMGCSTERSVLLGVACSGGFYLGSSPGFLENSQPDYIHRGALGVCGQQFPSPHPLPSDSGNRWGI